MATGVSDRIKQLIVEHLDMPTPPGFDERTPLFEGGLGMDSFTAVELITLIEKHFGIEFNVDDIRPEHFADVNTLAKLVVTYLSPQ